MGGEDTIMKDIIKPGIDKTFPLHELYLSCSCISLNDDYLAPPAPVATKSNNYSTGQNPSLCT